VSKMEGALQELDETSYWLELLDEAGVMRGDRLSMAHRESQELLAIFVASAKTAKASRCQG